MQDNRQWLGVREQFMYYFHAEKSCNRYFVIRKVTSFETFWPLRLSCTATIRL